MIGWPFLVADDDRLERRSEIQFYNYPQPHTCTFQALVTFIIDKMRIMIKNMTNLVTFGHGAGL